MKRVIQSLVLGTMLAFLVEAFAAVDRDQQHRAVTFGGRLETPTRLQIDAFNTEAAEALRGAAHPMPQSQMGKLRAAATADDPVFSWRSAGYVTPARDQRRCGDCYVFGSVAALEGNWALRHNKQMIDASEQHVLNCAPGDCSAGGYISTTMTFLVNQGTCDESDDRYAAAKRSCTAKPIKYKPRARAYVAGNGRVPSRQTLKNALLTHGPITAFIYAAGMDAAGYWNSDKVVADNVTGGNHIIAIVGWDDGKSYPGGKGAWEIKNSWGPDWGRGGFGYVAYGVRDIGDNAMWVEFASGARNPENVPLGKKAASKP
jgi:C1A family cysteine protease